MLSVSKYGICSVSVAPLRKEGSDASEMVSQILFGEKVLILDVQKNWIYVQCDYDDYKGWTDVKLIHPISEEAYMSVEANSYSANLFNLATENNLPLTLTIGTPLPNLNEDQIIIEGKSIQYLGEARIPNLEKSQLVEFSKNYLNVPYLWGGRSSFGIDCSGFTQQVYRMANIKLPRDAYQQAEHGITLNFVEEAEPGDIAFFENREGRIIHVGIVLKDQKIIHAHGKVRIDILDSNGIFNIDSKKYSHQLRIIKRLLD